ncbi:MAG: NADH-quinone oxidoreductase subunit N [Gemmatimonadetes bacterium]|nr:NADH-quinone oxidoreductase subunit N [Gemmatimonadota bacterium]
MQLDFSTNLHYVWALLPEIVLSVWAMMVLLLDVLQKGNRTGPSHPMIPWLTLAGLVLTAGANVWLMQVDAVGTAGVIAVDSFRIFANFIFLLAAALAILISFGYVDRHKINMGEFYVLIAFATVGMMLMAAARELILIFLALELMSVSIYVLVGLNRQDPRSAEASLKYFLLGAFASAFFLYGIALIFGATGTTHLPTIASLLAGGFEASTAMLLSGVALTAVGFAFKVAAVPFHVWTPDAYDGAPTPVTALMATGVKAAAFAAFIRVFPVSLAGVYDQWSVVVWWLAVLTMVGANLIALTQGSVKRMLAYSSIAHAGYLLVALVSANQLGAAAFLFYLLVYTVMTVGAFGVVIANARGPNERVALEDYAGLGWQQPLLAAAFSIFLLSLAGFPLTGGFIGKLYILRAALDAGHAQLAVILVLASLISYFYYLRVVIVMYMRPAPAEDTHSGLHVPVPALVAVAVAAVAVLGLFFYPAYLLGVAEASVASLFAAPEASFGLRP